MVVSILTRKTRIKERAQFESQLAVARPKIEGILRAQAGFVSVQYLWGLEDDGEFAQVTSWHAAEDCQKYVREGGAATVATIEDAALPTAAHPDGAWVRKTFETAS